MMQSELYVVPTVFVWPSAIHTCVCVFHITFRGVRTTLTNHVLFVSKMNEFSQGQVDRVSTRQQEQHWKNAS